MDVANLSKFELIATCRELGITKISSKNKSQLVEIIKNFNVVLTQTNLNNNVQNQPNLNNNHLTQINLNNNLLTQINLNNNVQNQPNLKLNVLDLFCGCGGMSKGLTDSGLNIIAGIDIWNVATNSYNQNFEHKAFNEDLTQFSPEQFNEKYNKENKVIDILVGGPPCQSFSIAGKRDKNDPRNALFMEYVKYLNYFKPKAFIMENVIGMLSKKTDNGEKVIDIIMEQLSIDYNCEINKLFASDFEVPQNRRRIIIIGIRKDLNIIPSKIEEFIKIKTNRIPVKNILLPKEQIEQSYFLSEKAIKGIANKKEKSKEKGTGFGAQILNLDKPSYTIPARYWKDGYDALVKYDDNDIRRLTILELKRIQTFPDDYVINGSKKEIIMQIGNAVACRFAYHLGIYIQNVLKK